MRQILTILKYFLLGVLMGVALVVVTAAIFVAWGGIISIAMESPYHIYFFFHSLTYTI